MSGRYLLAVMVATFATAIFLIVRNKATEQETLDMLTNSGHEQPRHPTASIHLGVERPDSARWGGLGTCGVVRDPQ